MKKIFAILAAFLSWGGVMVLAQDWGGRYNVEWKDGDETYASGSLFLVPVAPEQAEFLLVATNKAGASIVYDSEAGPVSLLDGKFVWRFPNPEFDYTLTIELYPESENGLPLENTIKLSEQLGSGAPPYAVDLCPDGYYKRDLNYFVAPGGYMYRKDGDGCYLAQGGIYSGSVILPESLIGPFGKVFTVKGIDSDALAYSRHVTQVSIANAEQRVAPGALSYTEVPYDWDRISKPFFAYPGKARDCFVIPYYDGFVCPENTSPWVIFKQNVAPAQLSKNTIGDNNALAGRVDQAFDRTMGVYYTLQIPKEEINKMFRGYTAMEIEALVSDADFVAFHTFPAFGRWKFPEKVQNAPKAIVSKVAKQYGREVMYSRRAAWLRDGSGELDIVEFTHKDHQAMVVFAWVSAGELAATCKLSTEIESEFEDCDVWNVDDDGTFGIPDVVTIALDPDGRPIIFLAKNAPESITCFALRQVGDKLVIEDYDQWYRYVDIQ